MNVQGPVCERSIRSAVMSDLFKIKVFSVCIVAAAALTYLLTDSTTWYVGIGLAGVVGFHYGAFAWARKYVTTARSATVRPARAQKPVPLLDPVFGD